MRSIPFTTALAIASCLGYAAPAQAHHSFAMFDIDNKITLNGTVRELRWANPHVLILVLVDEEDEPEPVLWTIEMTSTGNLRRRGWNQETVKPGDDVELVVNPLRDGGPGAGFFSLKFVDTGEELIMERIAPPQE